MSDARVYDKCSFQRVLEPPRVRNEAVTRGTTV